MSKKKNKFDLGHLVHAGYIKDGQILMFVSDPTKTCQVKKLPNGEYKVLAGGEITTIHAFAVKCLGQEPPDHAAKWFRTQDKKSLYELWRADDYVEAA